MAPDTSLHYIKLIAGTARGILAKVCEANGISLAPRHASELVPIPVYEEAPASLLTAANGMCPTEIKWVLKARYNYVPAYFTKYRDPETHRLSNQIVVGVSNYCMARFLAAKELMHCFLDWEDYPATNSIPLVSELIDDLVAGGNTLLGAGKQTLVDEIAWFGAALYLVPQEWLPALVAVRQAIAEQDPKADADLHIAQLIRVPESIVRQRLRHADAWATILRV
ncbi:hypothetical protein ACOTCL_18305 [Achromobacter xylosoxidans]